MRSFQPTSGACSARGTAVHGVVVAVVAFLGVDCAWAAWTPLDKTHRPVTIAARMVVPTSTASRLGGGAIALGSALLILLILGRTHRCIAPAITRRPAFSIRRPVFPADRVRRRESISYHLGGLHGP